MKCGLNRVVNIFKFCLFSMCLTCSVLNIECISASNSKQGKDMLADFDYLVSQLYLQHCTFVEIGEGVCSLFIELTLDNGHKKSRKQMFFGNCLCSEFRKWHLCSYTLTSQRPEDCEFQEGTSCPSSSARVHRRLCDVTGMSQWNPQCNCSVTLAGAKQEHMCGFRTCYADPMPTSICGPRTVCGTAYCDVTLHGSLYSAHCDRKCLHHQPFCEDPCPLTSLKRKISSEWAEWRSVSPTDNKCNMKQFETECLDESKQPAFDCLGPGLLCCGKDEADCTCEVKMEDGKLKAFRYLIKFADRCDDTTNSKLNVRSIGLKGDAKVWSRIIGPDSRQDKGDSISMFGNPEELYRRRFGHEQKKFGSDFVRKSLQNSVTPGARPIEKVTGNRSQKDKIIKSNISHNVLGTNGSAKSVNLNLPKISPNPTSTIVEGKQKVIPNKNKLPIISNNSKNNDNFNQNQQNPQKVVSNISEILNEKSLTPLPYTNMTNKAKVQEQKNDDGKIMAEGIINLNNINATSINDVKSPEEQRERENNKNIIQNQSQNNQQTLSDKIMIVGDKEKNNNSSVKTAESTEDAMNNQNIILQKPMITTLKNNSLNTNTLGNSLQSLDAKTQIEGKASEPQIKETDNNKENLINNYNDNSKKALTNKVDTQDNKMLEKISNDNNHQSEGKVLNTNSQQNRAEIESKENHLSVNREHLDTIISQEKNPNTQSIPIMPITPKNDLKSESKIGSDTNKKKKKIQSTEETENVASKQEMGVRGTQIYGDRTKSQENSSVDEEDKVELRGNDQQAAIYPVQIKQGNNLQKNKEIEHSVTSNLLDKEVTTNGNDATTRRIYTGKAINNPTKEKLLSEDMTMWSSIPMSNALSVSLNQNKQQHISGLSNIVKLTTAGSQYNSAAQISDKINDSKIAELNSQRSLSNESIKAVNSLQNNTSPSVNYTDQNNMRSFKKQSLNKKVQVMDISNVLPNVRQYVTPEGMSALSSKRRLKPQFLLEDEENGIKMNTQNVTTSGLTPPNNTAPSATSSSQTNVQPITKTALDKKVQVSEVASLSPNVTPGTMTGAPSKRKSRPGFLHKNEETGITLNIQTMTTPDLWGSIAKKLFKSHSQELLTDQQDPFRMLSDSNPSISLPREKPPNDYDEPEPILKDLNKVDKDNVDEKTAEALNQIADLKDLPGKIEWSEKSIGHNDKRDFEKDKNLEDGEIVNPFKKSSTLNPKVEKKKRQKSKVKAN